VRGLERDHVGRRSGVPSPGEPQAEPTIAKAINGGYDLLEAKCNRHNLKLIRSGPTRNVVRTTHVGPNPTNSGVPSGAVRWPGQGTIHRGFAFEIP
jgi:hypothetical protein